MAGYQGDIHLGDTIDIKFVTTAAATGAPTTLSGTPVISAYVGNSTTQITAGITLSADFDGVTGLNNVRVVASSGNGFGAATNVSLIITTGTVGGTSAVGYEVGSFSIDNRPVNVGFINAVATTSVTTVNANMGTTQPLNFTGTAGSALVKGDTVDIAGAAVSTSSAQIGVNVVNFGGSAGTFASGRPEVNTTHLKGTSSAGTAGYVAPDFTTVTLPAGAIPALGIIDNGTAQSATGTTLVLRSAAAFADSELIGATLVITSATAGAGQRRTITANVGSTDTVTVDTWTTTPTGTITYAIFGSAPSSSDLTTTIADAVWDAVLTDHLDSGSTGAALNSAGSAGDPWGTALPGAYGVGTAGKIIGDNIDAAVSSRMASYTQPTGFLAATFPGTVASPTNITAGTMTTVTNLTNAPTVGDFTATMKTSIGTAVAASAVASVTAPVALTSAYDAAKTAAQAGDAMTLSGDLTATMKTSVTTAATAATPTAAAVTGNVGGNVVGSVASVTAPVSLTGDLTATMKTSVTTAATAATPTISTLGANTITAASIAADAGTEIAAAVLAAATATPIDANVKEVNDVALTGTGVLGDEWGPA